MSITLHDYTDVESPVVREIKPVLSPIVREIFGFVGPSKRNENCLVCLQKRAPDKDGSHEYYRNLVGDSLDECDLNAVSAAGVTRTVIY